MRLGNRDVEFWRRFVQVARRVLDHETFLTGAYAGGCAFGSPRAGANRQDLQTQVAANSVL